MGVNALPSAEESFLHCVAVPGCTPNPEERKVQNLSEIQPPLDSRDVWFGQSEELDSN